MLELEIEQSIYKPYLDQIWENQPYGAPRGTFYQIDKDTIPYLPRPTVLRLKTDRINEPLKMWIERSNESEAGVDSRENADEYDIIPTSENSTISVQLGLGKNKILIETTTGVQESFFFYITVNDILTIWLSFLRDFYTNVIRKVDVQKQAINSLYATRLVEPFLPIQDLLPEIQSLRTLATRLSVNGILHSSGTNEGTNDLIKALSLSNPVYNQMDKDWFEFDPEGDPWTNLASQFYGTEAHVWIPNYGITKFTTLVKYLSANPSQYEIVDINEQQIRYMFQGKLHTHSFDLDRYGADFIQQLARTECFNNIRVSMTIESLMSWRMKGASYTFDLVLENPIGNARSSFDVDLPFDSNLPFDSDDVDPWSDGWIGWSLSGRFEQYENQQLGLDTFIAQSQPEFGNPWPYYSYFTQSLNTTRSDIPLDVELEIESEETVYEIIQITSGSDTGKFDVWESGLKVAGPFDSLLEAQEFDNP